MPRDKPNEPGDVILNRVMPDASDEEREAARANLYEYAAAILRLNTRLAEERDDTIRSTGDVPVNCRHAQSR